MLFNKSQINMGQILAFQKAKRNLSFNHQGKPSDFSCLCKKGKRQHGSGYESESENHFVQIVVFTKDSRQESTCHVYIKQHAEGCTVSINVDKFLTIIRQEKSDQKQNQRRKAEEKRKAVRKTTETYVIQIDH